jgi:hypothetical protein
MDVETASRFNGRLAHAGVDWVRNARRCLDGIVQELTQGETVDVERLQGDATCAYRAARHAAEDMARVAADLEPYAALLDPPNHQEAAA